MKLSDAEMEMLSPAEREGLNDGRAPGDESQDEDTVDKIEAEDESEAAGEIEAETAAKVSKAKAPKEEPAAEESTAEDADDEKEDNGPMIVAPMLNEGEARDYTKERAELRKLYDEGELSQDEYDDKRDAIAREESKADFAKDYNQAAASGKWKAEQDIFFGNYPQFETKPGLRAALDAHVVRLDAETKQTLSGYQLLQKARKAVNEELGLVPAKSDDAPVEKTVSKTRPIPTQADATKRAVDRAPKTLGDLPAADDGDAGENRFAYLDALANKGGMAYEQALAKLSKADEAEYLGN